MNYLVKKQMTKKCIYIDNPAQNLSEINKLL